MNTNKTWPPPLVPAEDPPLVLVPAEDPAEPPVRPTIGEAALQHLLAKVGQPAGAAGLLGAFQEAGSVVLCQIWLPGQSVFALWIRSQRRLLTLATEGQPGDLVFLDDDGDGLPEGLALVERVEEGALAVLSIEEDGIIRRASRPRDARIYGFARMSS